MPNPASDLTPTQRRALKARAHSLHPVVIVGAKRLTAAVLKEIDANLKAHELIKVKLADDRAERESQIVSLREALGATAVQHIGKVVVVFRESPGELEPVGRRRLRRTSRPGSRIRAPRSAPAPPPPRPRTFR